MCCSLSSNTEAILREKRVRNDSADFRRERRGQRTGTRVLLAVLLLQRLVVPPQSVGLFAEGDVSRLQLFEEPLRFIQPEQKASVGPESSF